MIEYIKGELTELTPVLAVVEAVGVGYALQISLNTYSAIQGKKDAKLYVHEALVTGGRDDSFTLYGFATKQERELYRLLITVSGVGANTARMILSSLSPKELCNVIANGDERVLKGVKGIDEAQCYINRQTGYPEAVRVKLFIFSTTIKITDFHHGGISDDLFTFPRSLYADYTYADKRQ